jgi:hypothetical protein
MANQPGPLEFATITDLASFQTALGISGAVKQTSYIYEYLRGIKVSTLVIEPVYFDRDYLHEFSAFYSLSAKGYDNFCRRAHFFSDSIDRAIVEAAAGGSEDAQKRMQAAYQGFSAIRPIDTAPFGRTVLHWYSDKDVDINPRVEKPSRNYKSHLCGIELTVFGLAWQQQDQGVSACATIGLWTTLHSSAFNERYAIPTTVAITQAAHKSLSLGARTFPSRGLFHQQICEAIKEFGLAPYMVEGDQAVPVTGSSFQRSFSPDKFCNTVASLVRSGFPCTLVGEVIRPGEQTRGGHVNVCVGFRAQPSLQHNQIYADGDMAALYIHDDNIGPAVRFTVGHYDTVTCAVTKDSTKPMCLVPDNPAGATNVAASTYGIFIPAMILAAVEGDLRTSAEVLIQKGIIIRAEVEALAKADATARKQALPTLTVGTQYATAATYVGDLLRERLSNRPAVLARARLGLVETVGPMSLYVGIVRLADANGPVIDFLYDTTDSDFNHPLFVSVCYDAVYAGYLGILNKVYPGYFDKIISAY